MSSCKLNDKDTMFEYLRTIFNIDPTADVSHMFGYTDDPERKPRPTVPFWIDSGVDIQRNDGTDRSIDEDEFTEVMEANGWRITEGDPDDIIARKKGYPGIYLFINY